MRLADIAALSARAHRSKKLIVTRASNTKLNNADLSRDRPARKSPRYLCPSTPARQPHPLTRPSLIRVQGYKILNKNLHKMVSNSDWNRRAQAAQAMRSRAYSAVCTASIPLRWTCFTVENCIRFTHLPVTSSFIYIYCILEMSYDLQEIAEAF